MKSSSLQRPRNDGGGKKVKNDAPIEERKQIGKKALGEEINSAAEEDKLIRSSSKAEEYGA